jgi:uroporphyrinogen decarboxylase
MISSRERVVAALSHRETDRPPQDLGSTCNTSITRIAYRNLREYCGMDPDNAAPFLSKDMQVVEVDRALLERLHIDTRGVHAGPPDVDRSAVLSSDSFGDEWGIRYRAAVRDGEILYYDAVHSPLAAASSVSEIERHPWPDPDDPGRTRGLREKARSLREKTACAIVGHMGDTSIFQACTTLRGMENFFVDLLTDGKMAGALMENVLRVQSEKMERWLAEVGGYLDVVSVGDDFGGQSGPLVSPDLFRRMIKPFLRRYFDIIRGGTQARLHLHSCGAIGELLPDLIDLGVEIINPVQVSAKGMDPALLKKKFGKDLSFWGGIDTQKSLPFGKPEDVRNEARRIAGILGKGGGYVLNPVHNIQPDVPPENVIAMYDAFFEHSDQGGQ